MVGQSYRRPEGDASHWLGIRYQVPRNMEESCVRGHRQNEKGRKDCFLTFASILFWLFEIKMELTK